MRRIVGIDLGTTYSCVGVFNEKKGVYEILPTRSGQQTMPSVVALNERNEVLVGDAAKRQLAIKPDRTVAEIKRHMGELGPEGGPYFAKLGDRAVSPEEVSAYILRELKDAAEKALGEPVTAAVITVPAYFKEPQRQATMRAGQLAGLEVKRIINEPTAAAIAYGHQASAGDDDDDDAAAVRSQNILIYDLGGGTFDVSVMEVSRGNLRVRATHGDPYLGGVDFDERIKDWVCAQIRARWGVDLLRQVTGSGKEADRARKALARIRTDVEGYKKELSSQSSVSLTWATLGFLDPRSGETVEDIVLDLSRAELEQMIQDKLTKTMTCVDAVLADAKLTRKDIAEVLLVGGSTRIPLVKQMLARYFGHEPKATIHPDLCVALGAAHEALKHVDTSQAASALDREAVEAQIAEQPAVVDVTGHSLGVAMKGDVLSVIIPRQSPIPVLKNERYHTVEDNQRVAQIMVYQGEDERASRNTLLREFSIGELPPRRAGEVDVDVTFALDTNATLEVTARIPLTGQQVTVEIKDPRLIAAGAIPLIPPADRRAEPFAAPAVSPALSGVAVSSPPAPSPASGQVGIPEPYRDYLEKATRLVSSLPDGDARRLRAAMDRLRSCAERGATGDVEEAGGALLVLLYELSSQ